MTRMWRQAVGRGMHELARPLRRSASAGSRLTASCSAAQPQEPIAYPEQHQALIPAPQFDAGAGHSWAEEGFQTSPTGEPAQAARHIFCNRTLDMSAMQAIGFDMDYTLAQYKPETFEHLAYSQTVHKLTANFGYPQELLHLSFDWQYMMRGLTIDKLRGNIIKVDRHKYVKVAYHGFRKLSKQERQAAYASGLQRLSFTGDDYTTIDTLFSLAEAYLFMQVVGLKDTQEHAVLNGKPYKDMYRDIRGAVDLCHRDGSLKAEVAACPAKYIHPDEKLKDLLVLYRKVGRKVFLATNSLWDYTNVVMNFLVDGATGSATSLDWLQYFDIVVTGCGKPAFFSERNLLFAVNPANAALSNTDNGAPILPIVSDDLPTDMPPSRLQVKDTKVFQGGSVADLHQLLGIADSSAVLYVGDHIYGDILTSKKSMGWRTMLIVPELQMELQHAAACEAAQRELAMLRRLRDGRTESIHRLEWGLSNPDGDTAEELEATRRELEALREERDRLARLHKEKLKRLHDFFHPVWGQMLKTGYQNSMYASLMERFACLYTSHVSNLALYSPYMKFRGRVDVMAHEHGHAADPADAEPSVEREDCTVVSRAPEAATS